MVAKDPGKRDTCRLTLTIRGVDYLVTPEPSARGRSWRLRRADGKAAYVVAETSFGPKCSCGDQAFRHRWGADGGCKHIRACRVLGLICPG